MTSPATLNTITRWLNFTFAIPMIILGIVGAILSVVIFTKQRAFWRNAGITYLLAGAAVTGIHLPLIYSQSILVHGFGLGVFNSSESACREHNYLLYMTTVAAISFPCWAAFDQYASTCRDARFRNRWSSIRVVRWAIVGTVIFWTLVYLPILFVSDININGICVLRPGSFTTFNTYFLTPFVYSIGPLVVMTVFTIGTVRNLRSVQSLNRQGRLTNQVRRMLVPQLIVLGISGVPFGFEGIYLDITSTIDKDDYRVALEYLISQVILLLFHCNYVCTFYIYLYMSSEVRRALKRLVYRAIRRNEVAPTDVTAETQTHLRTIQTAPIEVQ